ncbi:MAG: sulfur carrier protein ThiS [Planctomycetes bacterium]|nr:sulfur carrier protein ThiS [Planctomycetota bacterium]
MNIRVNGTPQELDEAVTVAKLVERLALPRDAIAVEINRCIVPRSTYDRRVLREGDQVEIVTIVGGG